MFLWLWISSHFTPALIHPYCRWQKSCTKLVSSVILVRRLMASLKGRTYMLVTFSSIENYKLCYWFW